MIGRKNKQAPRIDPHLPIWCKRIKVFPTQQPNRVLADKPPTVRVVIPEQVVMQPRLRIKVLVLKSERLMGVRVDLVLCGQFSPSVILPRPQQVAELIRLFPRNADLVGVVVGQVEFLVLFVQEHMRQGFVAVLVGRVQAAFLGL